MASPTNSLERALLILEHVSLSRDGLTHAEISRFFSLPISTCSYILSRLELHGYVRRDKDTGRYDIGAKVLGLVHYRLQENALAPVLMPALQGVLADTGLNAAVAVLSRGHVLVVADAHTAEPLPVRVGNGSDLCFGSGAMGRVLAAWLSERQLTELMQRYGPPKGNPRNNSSPSNLRYRFLQELEQVRKEGYAVNESAFGLRSLAVPIRGDKGSVCAALVVAGTRAQPAWKQPRQLIGRLRTAADELSKTVGATQWQPLS